MSSAVYGQRIFTLQQLIVYVMIQQGSVVEFISLTAFGKKLFFSLVVLAQMLCNLLPEGKGANSSCAGWVESLMMQEALSLNILM